MEKFIRIIQSAQAVLNTINEHSAAEGGYVHNPNNHVQGVARSGDSVFFEQIKDMDDIYNLISIAKSVELVVGEGGGVCFVFDCPTDIGDYKWLETFDNGTGYEIQEVHGSLVPVGEALERTVHTSFFTVVLTPEKVGADVRYALASIYPGWPCKPANREGLSVGMKLTADEVDKRNLRVKLPVKN